jgi:hypothetical protein
MKIEVFYNADFPILMTARGPGGYPMVHAVLCSEIDPTRLVIEFQALWTYGKHTEADVSAVRDELIKEVHDSYQHHNLIYKIDGKYYKLAKGLLNKYGVTMIAQEER